MTLDTSFFVEYNQDPKFYQDLEMQYRNRMISMDYYRTDFELQLKTGSQITIDDEIQLNDKDATGQDAHTYQSHGATAQTFTVDKMRRISERLFDIDKMRSVFDVKEIIRSNGLNKLMQAMDKYRFQKLYDNAYNVTSTVDLTSLSTNAAKGNAIYDTVMDANTVLDVVDEDGMRRKAAFTPNTLRYLKDADKLTDATAISQEHMRMGRIGLVDNTMIDRTNNLYQATTDYTVNAKGAATAGVKTFTIDNNGSGTINKPEIGDTFSNTVDSVSETFTILTVKEVTANVEYVVIVDKQLGTTIADNASITVTGNHTAYVPIVEGRPGQSVIQKDPMIEGLRDPSYSAWLLRGDVVYDAFLSYEMARKLVIVPIKWRTIS